MDQFGVMVDTQRYTKFGNDLDSGLDVITLKSNVVWYLEAERDGHYSPDPSDTGDLMISFKVV